MAASMYVKPLQHYYAKHVCQRLLLQVAPVVVTQQMSVTNKHYLPKWRKERAKKVYKFDLPDWQEIKADANMAPEEMRSRMKKNNQLPPRTFQERNIIIGSTSDVFEAYIPPEGDGLASPISGKRAQQKFSQLEKKSKSFLQLRKVKQFEEDFDSKTFAEKAQAIYVEANDLLQDIPNNQDRLHELVTEKAYPEMTWKLDKKTFRWQFIESIEPPRIVHVRQTDLISKENVYGQITVRFNTKQTLAIYDRFGRLMYGSEELQKDCLEYVVFEKHLSDTYGAWRVHGKIAPDWMPPTQPVFRTLRKPAMKEYAEEEEKKGEGKEGEGKEGEKEQGEGKGELQPATA